MVRVPSRSTASDSIAEVRAGTSSTRVVPPAPMVKRCEAKSPEPSSTDAPVAPFGTSHGP